MGPSDLRGHLHAAADERLAEDVLHGAVILALVHELLDHGDGVVGLRVVGGVYLETVEWHEGNLTRQSQTVHLLQDLGARAVVVNDVVEESVTSGDLDSGEEGLVTLKVLNEGAIVAVNHLRVLLGVLEELQHLVDAVDAVQESLCGVQ